MKASKPVDRVALQRQLQAVNQKIEAATERLISVAAVIAPAVEKRLLELHRERDAIQADLDRKAAEPPKKSAKAIAAKVWQLNEVLAKGSAQKVRAALSQIVERVTVHFEKGEVYRNLGHRYLPSVAEISLCSKAGGNL